ncbi:MAG: chemotaxis-specific protein-glutamate methyltransferase CheB [Rhodospirillaceae bacterium]|nr:chemotaxis-specific protein-glutamate methyltransferase CheB [Rhodospirillaceae bacterium]MBT5666905.1 chemotaxis-specific protein-glutamate methyltransferase CheB [Rhodospirillaceae bacterium]MBT5808779.1 chemotaxis-specific protein-glutamate methyltransferase CheB [Rhodospirillaceae bacterium]
MNTKKTVKSSVLVIAEPGVVGDNLTQALKFAPNLEVVGPFETGPTGVSAFGKYHADTIILDIGALHENPLVTLNRLLQIDPHAKIIMASTLTFSNVRKSMTGFERGAADFIQMPGGHTRKTDKGAFRADLLRLIGAMADARRNDTPRQIAGKPTAKTAEPRKSITLRDVSPHRPSVLAVGSSTGGPEALNVMIDDLPDDFPLPILITQHMPKLFTALLADTISKRTGKIAVEAAEGMTVEPGKIYIAPGDHHMTITGTPTRSVIRLNQEPPVNYCRPSVEPMLQSIVRIYKEKTLVVILTGMGADGQKGAELAVESGGSVIAQDADTSVVWGMPGAVAEAGLCCQVLPIDQIAAAVWRIVKV